MRLILLKKLSFPDASHRVHGPHLFTVLSKLPHDSRQAKCPRILVQIINVFVSAFQIQNRKVRKFAESSRFVKFAKSIS